MDKIRVGVVGVGSMGLNHIRVYRALHDRCELAGVFDADTARCQAVAAAHKLRAFDSLEALLGAVDAVSVVVPTVHHEAVTMRALERGVHTLVEKPIADTPAAGLRMAQAAWDAHVTLQVGHVERFNPVVQLMPDILQGKTVLAMDFRRLSPYDPRIADVDVVQDLMIHDIDVLRHLLPGSPARVQAMGCSPRSGSRVDHAVALLDINGVPVTLTASRVTEQKVRLLCVTTDQAYIEMNYLERKIGISRVTHSGFSSTPQAGYRQEGIVEKVLVPNVEPLREELSHFLDCARDGSSPLVGGDDGVEALRIAERIRAEIYH